jgi:signal transduction histidine kinase
VYTQIRFLLIGVSFFFVIGLITNSVLPAIFDVYFFNGIGPSFSLILAGFIVYIISRHHFLNISSYVQRGFIYLLLSIFVVCSYLGILAAANELFKFTSNINTEFITIVTCLVGIFTVPHLNSFLKRKTDRFFFKDKYQYETVLLELSELLNMSISLHEIQTKTTHILKLALRAEAVHIRLGTSQLQPAPYITELFTVQSVPLQTDGEHQGELLVAQKCSGDAYTKVDIQLLETVSRQLSVSLQRAMLHKKIEEYNHELEEKVWDRTAELRNAHRNQYDLITDISHGLQTPLTIVQSELEHLKRGASKPQRFQTFEKSISDLSVFIYDLLKLAQMESPSDTVQLTTCDLSGLLIDIAAYAGPPALDKNIFLNAQVQPEVYIYAHSKKIEEVVLALLGNAMKYIGSYTDKSIEIGLTKNATHAEIRVTDSGIGIPTEHSSNIFTRFYRVKDRRMSNVAGTGLGLSLVQAIVKKHNGNIRVESIVEVGTTFIVTLPLIPCPDA